MEIKRFEDIEGWQHARKLSNMVYGLTKKRDFSKDFGLKDQIQRASGSAMDNLAEGFDSESNAEFIRFLRYAKRSCSEVQSQLYLALDLYYIDQSEFDIVYQQASRTRATLRGFIRYLLKFKSHSSKSLNLISTSRTPKREVYNGERTTGNGEPLNFFEDQILRAEKNLKKPLHK